ncbi:hypothetical protein CVE36_23000, partial [Pseudomonas syringae pv. actinidiae]|nr:hypothetical protein [Pseudomonas syringae pv. actinidiae]
FQGQGHETQGESKYILHLSGMSRRFFLQLLTQYNDFTTYSLPYDRHPKTYSHLGIKSIVIAIADQLHA